MNLNQLKIFYLAAKRKNLSRAAQELNITQPAVTKGLQRFQEQYDIRLLNRFDKKMVLTDAGEALFRVAEKIFDLEIQAEESIREFKQQKRGHIRIHASESFGAYYLPSILNPFSKKHPDIRVSATVLPTEDVIRNVANLNNDIGFISYPVAHPKVVTQEILEDQVVFITHPDDTLTRKKHLTYMDLARRRMIVHESGSVPSQIIERFMEANKIDISIPMELSSNRGILRAASDGLGIALVCRKVAQEHIERGEIVTLPFPGPPMTRKFYLVYHKDKYFSALLQRLLDRVSRWSADYTHSLGLGDSVPPPEE